MTRHRHRLRWAAVGLVLLGASSAFAQPPEPSADERAADAPVDTAEPNTTSSPGRRAAVELSPLLRRRFARSRGPFVGGRAGVMLGLGMVELALGLSIDGGRSTEGEVEVRAQAGAVRALVCARVTGPRVRAALLPCLGASAGLQRVRLRGASDSSPTIWATFAPRAELALRVPLTARLALRAGGALERPILRRRLAYTDDVGASRVGWGRSSVVVEALLALEIHFLSEDHRP